MKHTKTTTLFLTLLIAVTSTLSGEDSKPYVSDKEHEYSTYKSYELPLPKIYLDRKTRPATWVYKKYGMPPLPLGNPHIYQFLGRTTAAATHGEWFHLTKVVYPEWITRPSRYVIDADGDRRRLVSFTVEVRCFPGSKKTPVVYDAFMVVGDKNEKPLDLLGVANPAFPTPEYDYEIVKIFAPYINESRTISEEENNRSWALNYVEEKNKEARQKRLENIRKMFKLFPLRVNK